MNILITLEIFLYNCLENKRKYILKFIVEEYLIMKWLLKYLISNY